MGLDNNRENLRVTLELDDLKEIIYWIILKYNEDDFHQQQASSRRDLLGGFIDRWVNKIPESIIFDKLLEEKDKEYSVVTDYFLYGQDTKKEAPDVLGLKDKKDNYFKFVLFDDGDWIIQEGSPSIEMKTFRDNQNLITVPKRQWDDDKYYAIIESHVRRDFLLSLFSNDFFDYEESNSIFNKIENKMVDEFVKRDNNKLRHPLPLEKIESLGEYELLGIYTGKELLKFATLVEGSYQPIYFDDVCEPPENNVNHLENPISLKNGYNYILEKNDSKIEQSKKDIMFYLELEEDAKMEVKKINQKSMDVDVKGEVKIDGKTVKPGFHRLCFKKFPRTGNTDEYVVSKRTVAYCGKDSTNDLMKLFDKIVNIN